MKVVVYSTNSCPYCVMVKEWLDEQGIEFIEKNVQEDPAVAEEMVEKSGQMGVPVTDIDGQIVVGFNVSKLKKLLNVD